MARPYGQNAPMRLNERVALITGGSNGIGRACAERFAEEGAAIVIADLLEEPGHAAVEAITAAGGRASFIRLEASSRIDNHAAAEHAVQTFGSLDILVTAAGISHANYKSGDIEADMKRMAGALDYADKPGRLFVETELDEWQKVIDVNLTGTFLAVQAAASRMLDAGKGGSIITIASIAAKHPDAGPVAYTVSKAGVWMLTKKAARELAATGIRVNAIGPGYIETHMTQMIEFAPEERKMQLYGSIPMGRRGRPIEIANTALFLASDESSYFTGEILHPDGGFFTE